MLKILNRVINLLDISSRSFPIQKIPTFAPIDDDIEIHFSKLES